MKTIKLTKLLIASLWTLSLFSSCGSSQSIVEKQQKTVRIKENVLAATFTFQAVRAHPMEGQPINLTSSYDLKVSKDSVQAYLPYFGRAYVAPIYPSEAGIKFTSTKFDYQMVEGKRDGSWTITIKTLDTPRTMTLLLTVWDNGSAQLSVHDPDKQRIFFDGSLMDD